MRVFLALLLAHVVSTTGTELAGFGLGVWLYQRTGSTTVFALVALATVGPMILVGPFAGVLVDRWDRRVALVVAAAGGAVCSVVLASLHRVEGLGLGTAWLPLAIASCFAALGASALEASATLLVYREQLGRTNGLLQLGLAVPQLLAPVVAGALLETTGLGTLLLLDAGTYLFALAVMGCVRLPRPEVPEARRTSKWGALVEGWAFLRGHPGLKALLAFFAAVNFSLGIVVVVFTPLVLSFADSRALGGILSFAGLGMVAGGVFMAVWGGPRRQIHGVLGFTLLQGLLLLLGAARPSVPLVAAAAFGVMFTMPVISGCSRTIWQRKVPADLQGRVFSLRAAVIAGGVPLAYVLAGPLVDRVFEPLMADVGPLSASVGLLLGTGRGRGAALLFVALSCATLATVAAGALYPKLRQIDLGESPHPAP